SGRVEPGYRIAFCPSRGGRGKRGRPGYGAPVAVDPTGPDLKAFLADDPGGPVVMLNLLRFKPDGGRESYAKYSQALVEEGHLAKVGGEVLYAGEGSTALVAEDG